MGPAWNNMSLATVTDLRPEQIFSSGLPPTLTLTLVPFLGASKSKNRHTLSKCMTTESYDWESRVCFELSSPGQQVAVYAGHTGDVMSLR